MPFDPRFTRRFASTDEISTIVREAERRIRNHPRSWTIDRANELRNEALGVAGEWAVCEWLDLDPAPIFHNHGGGGDGGAWDFRLADGRTVEVKTTSHPNGILVIPPYQTASADLYVLCSRRGSMVVGAGGFCTREQYQERAIEIDFKRGCGPQRVVPNDALDLFADLVAQTKGAWR